MLLPDGRMGVIDFGAVAPLPGGLPVELGQMMRFALANDYEHLVTTMEKIGFIQPGEKVSVREIDDMLRQYIEPLQTDTFHFTRKWLQKMTAVQMDRSVAQIKTARQMDIPVKLAIPMRVIASSVAISCQLDAHVPVRAIALELVPGFAERLPPRLTGKAQRRLRCCRASPRVLARTSTRTLTRDDGAALEDLAAPDAPRLLPFQRCRQALADGSGSPRTMPWPVRGRRDFRRTTGRDHRHDTAPPAAISLGMSPMGRSARERSSQST